LLEAKLKQTTPAEIPPRVAETLKEPWQHNQTAKPIPIGPRQSPDADIQQFELKRKLDTAWLEKRVTRLIGE
jgi:hypothetical protein